MALNSLAEIVVQVGDFERIAHSILSRYETSSKSRVISLDQTRRELSALSFNQAKLLRESLDCIESGLYRSAHVAAWQAFIDLLSEELGRDGFLRVREARPKLTKVSSVEELRELTTEHDLILIARELKILAKAEVRILHGMLSKRNECAHPGTYEPNLNESIGYVSELLSRIGRIQSGTR